MYEGVSGPQLAHTVATDNKHGWYLLPNSFADATEASHLNVSHSIKMPTIQPIFRAVLSSSSHGPYRSVSNKSRQTPTQSKQDKEKRMEKKGTHLNLHPE
jgi:hypothetical protein